MSSRSGTPCPIRRRVPLLTSQCIVLVHFHLDGVRDDDDDDHDGDSEGGCSRPCLKSTDCLDDAPHDRTGRDGPREAREAR